jgi:hypothetical protein
MNCKEFEIKVDRYLDRELTDAEAREVQGHLNSCPACREEFGPLLQVFTSSWDVNASPSLRSRILDTLAKQDAFSTSQKRNLRWVWSTAAAAIILITVGWLVRPSSNQSQPHPSVPKQVAVASENPPAQMNPWILAGMVQSFAASGSANPVIALVQADVMEQWFRETYDTPFLPARVRYTLYTPEPAKPDIEVPILEFALFSTIQKL